MSFDLNCSGCVVNSSSQRDHRCMLPQWPAAGLHLYRGSDAALTEELQLRALRPPREHEYAGYACMHCGEHAFDPERTEHCTTSEGESTTTEDT